MSSSGAKRLITASEVRIEEERCGIINRCFHLATCVHTWRVENSEPSDGIGRVNNPWDMKSEGTPKIIGAGTKRVIFAFTNVIYEPVPWPRGLRRRSATACLLRSWVRIAPGAWMFVCCECCVMSGRGLCDELITRPEESYRLWCVVVCDLETSRMRRTWPALGRSVTKRKWIMNRLAVSPSPKNRA